MWLSRRGPMEWVFSLSDLQKDNLIGAVNVTQSHFCTLFKQSRSVQLNNPNSSEVRCRWSGPWGALDPQASHMRSGLIIESVRACQSPCVQERTEQALCRSGLGRSRHWTPPCRDADRHRGHGPSRLNLPALWGLRWRIFLSLHQGSVVDKEGVA